MLNILGGRPNSVNPNNDSNDPVDPLVLDQVEEPDDHLGYSIEARNQIL